MGAEIHASGRNLFLTVRCRDSCERSQSLSYCTLFVHCICIVCVIVFFNRLYRSLWVASAVDNAISLLRYVIRSLYLHIVFFNRLYRSLWVAAAVDNATCERPQSHSYGMLISMLFCRCWSFFITCTVMLTCEHRHTAREDGTCVPNQRRNNRKSMCDKRIQVHENIL